MIERFNDFQYFNFFRVVCIVRGKIFIFFVLALGSAAYFLS